MTTDGTRTSEKETLEFLISYLRNAKETGDEFSRGWVAIQIGISCESTYEEIEERLKRALRINKGSQKFNL